METQFTLDKRDKIWEGISLLLLLSHAIIIAITIRYLPDNIAVHFNGTGEANGWGNKNMLWLPFGFSIFMYLLMTYVSFRPGIYRNRMTDNNLEEQYKLTSKMSRTVKAYIIVAFISMSIFMYKTAQGLWREQSPFFLLIFLALVLPPCLYYALKFAKIN